MYKTSSQNIVLLKVGINYINNSTSFLSLGTLNFNSKMISLIIRRDDFHTLLLELKTDNT